MTVVTTEDGTLLTLAPDGTLDAALAESVRALVDGGLEDGKSRFLLSLQKVTHASSAGLEELVRLARKLADRGSRIALVGANPVMADILKATRLDRRFAVFESTEQALQSMRAEI